MDPRQQWMAFVLQQGLEYGLVSTEDVLRYATPRVIAGLPVELKSRLLKAGLNQGMFNPDVVLSVLTPEVLAGNVALPTLWGCIAEAGERVFGGDSVNVTSSDIDGGLAGMGSSGSRSSTSGSSSAASSTGRLNVAATSTTAASSSAGDSKSTPRPAASGTGSVRTPTGSVPTTGAAAPSAAPVAVAAAAPARGTSGPATLNLDGPPDPDPFAHIEGDSMIVIEDEPSHDFANYGADNTGVDHRSPLRNTEKPSDPLEVDRDRLRKRNRI